ncbi:hypothetical protein GGX14DRAFT_571878 [Mycena pura]|uniref:CxC2-like cysteine cluster KDZ transposase-associated domain-containing protein n=1 Tax=Mycena pura TaxID=153505 RepID=A0AAD6V9M4_9AGAR|nr:hypothetical protein GGX14DRAFT_571878 [Mycena pura]
MSRARGRNKRSASEEGGAAARVFSLDTLLPQPMPVDAPMVSFVERVSHGGRRIQRESADLAPTSPIKRARRAERAAPQPTHSPPEPDPTNSADERYQIGTDHDFTWLPEEDFLGEEPLPSPETSGARRAVPPADPAMRDWLLNYRDVYLRALLLQEGRRDASDECERCVGPRRGRVDGRYFKKSSLKALGLRVQFGHPPGESCQRPTSGSDGFVVLHDNGIHEVAVDFCRCKNRDVPWFLQLLRGGWYPSTTDQPQTCATFACLALFRRLSLTAKTSAYDFYSILEDMTDSTGVKPPGRYQVLLRMARQWRHLWLLMSGGRGHDPSGVLGTAAGELAIRCPACPRPGVNLPEGWENAAEEDRGLYVLFLALDACFRLKRRAVSSELKDPGLGTGWAYMVEWGPYRDYLVTVTDQTEMSTCTGLAALDYANTKFSWGYATTGVGMGVCVRHEFVQPNGVGDLQAGERYANMDYIFASLLRHLHPLIRKIVSYDIVCQWCKDLKRRLEELPPLVRCNILLSLFRFVIPKLHIKGHKLLCFLLFSLSLVPGSGCRGHRAMLGKHRRRRRQHETALLRRRIDDARVELERQEAAFEAFSVEQAERVPAWKAMLEAFEKDGTQKNPYELEVKGMTEIEMRNKLEEDEDREAAAGRLRRIRIQAELRRTSTAASKINLRASRRKLERSIERFRSLQATYTPGALVHLRSLKVASRTPAEEVPLVLPSALPAARRGLGGCVDGLVDAERALRDAQCRGTLVRLRRQLNIKARYLIYKKHHSRHQAMNTRSRTLVARNEGKICHHSEKYQAAWRALCTLTAGGEAAVNWKRLRKEDIRCMDDAVQLSRKKEKERRARLREAARNAELRSVGLVPLINSSAERVPDGDDDLLDEWEDVGESRREVSWIWTLAGTAGVNEQDLEDALRIEWTKAYSRTRRWREEVRTLGEEQRRIPVSFLHEERAWLDRAAAVPVGDASTSAAEAEGMLAYATAQADMYRALAMRAEVTRTQPKLRRGQRRPREAIRVVTSWPLEGGTEGDDDVEGDEDDELGENENELEDDRVLDGDEEDMQSAHRTEGQWGVGRAAEHGVQA